MDTTILLPIAIAAVMVREILHQRKQIKQYKAKLKKEEEIYKDIFDIGVKAVEVQKKYDKLLKQCLEVHDEYDKTLTEYYAMMENIVLTKQFVHVYKGIKISNEKLITVFSLN